MTHFFFSFFFFFFKQKTAYEMRISDWSSDVCSSDLIETGGAGIARAGPVGLDEIGDLRGFESARRLERDLAPGRVEMIAGRGNRRRCDGERASRLVTRMRDAADMPKLAEDGAAFRLDRGGHLAPALDLLRGLDAGRRGLALARLPALPRLGATE